MAQIVVDKCLSVKSKTENGIQCSRKPKSGHDFCGVHLRSKKPVIYSPTTTKNTISPNIKLSLKNKSTNINLSKNVKIELKPEPEFYDQLEFLEQTSENKINYQKLLKTFKFFKLQINGSKRSLIQKLVDYLKTQEQIKQAELDPSICNNPTDFYDFTNLSEIPKEYLFVFKCRDGLLYGMDLRSIHAYFQESEKSNIQMGRRIVYENPYNRQEISQHVINDYRDRIDHLKQNQKLVEHITEEEQNETDQVNHLVNDVFGTICATYGYTVDSNWFLQMNISQLLAFYRMILQNWTQIQESSRRNISPENINLFNHQEYRYIRSNNRQDLQRLLIEKIRILINNGREVDDRLTGVNLTLLCLATICNIPESEFALGI